MNLIRAKIWITGATSGIGEALALELGRRGAKCFLTARRNDILAQLCARIVAAGGSAESYPGDVTDLPALQAIIGSIERDHGPIDIVIANAGNHIFSVPERFDSAEYIGLMDLNFGGMLRTIEASLPRMLERKTGRIVGMASMAGFRGLPRAAAYGASKAAMIHFLESLRYHLERSGIAVTIINPGFVRTPLTDKNDFKMPFLVEPDHAARIIADGLERDKDEIIFPWPFSWVMSLMRIIPECIYRPLIKIVWRRTEAK